MFDPRLQFLKDGLDAIEIGPQWKGPCGHNMDDVVRNTTRGCKYCDEVNEYLMYQDFLVELHYNQTHGFQ